jgi:hypothetical protein
MNAQTVSNFKFWVVVMMEFNAVMLGYDNVSFDMLVP